MTHVRKKPYYWDEEKCIAHLKGLRHTLCQTKFGDDGKELRIHCGYCIEQLINRCGDFACTADEMVRIVDRIYRRHSGMFGVPDLVKRVYRLRTATDMIIERCDAEADALDDEDVN